MNAGCCGTRSPGPEDEAVIVDIVTAVAPPQGGFIEVSLRDHEPVRLDEARILTTAHLSFLQTSRDYKTAVYLEIDPATRVIDEVLAPYDSPVLSVNEQADRAEVLLVYSAAYHFLLRSHPDYARMISDLRSSVEHGNNLLITESRDEHFIIDVRDPLPERN
ncbi:MAG: hypothetical protein GYA21_11360 [Myxococcales bacterium]|nr:hypothetical protein [Myxococcales bacterium]